MARTDITPLTIPTRWATTPLEITPVAADVGNGNSFTLSGDEILITYNSSADTDYYVTIDSVADTFGRESHITQFDIPFGDYYAFPRFAVEGWIQSDGKLYIDCENAAILLMVIRLPAGSN